MANTEKALIHRGDAENAETCGKNCLCFPYGTLRPCHGSEKSIFILTFAFFASLRWTWSVLSVFSVVKSRRKHQAEAGAPKGSWRAAVR